MHKFLAVLVMFFCLQCYVKADDRVLVIDYSPNQIVEVYTGTGYTTTIEFGDENINAVAIGDTANFQASPFKNKVFVKPTASLASKEFKATNMTVVTDKRDYYFQIYLNGQKKPTFILKFRYGMPSYANSVKGNLVKKSSVPNISTEDSRRNQNNQSKQNVRNNQIKTKNSDLMKKRVEEQKANNLLIIRKVNDNSYYKISANSKILVDNVYDNGINTFFIFNEKQRIPNIYYVDERGKEFLLVPEKNLKNRAVLVNKVSGRFTLRLGTEVACIINDKLLHPELYPEQSTIVEEPVSKDNSSKKSSRSKRPKKN